MYVLHNIHGLIEFIEQEIAQEEREATHSKPRKAEIRQARANALKLLVLNIKNSDLYAKENYR
jgi:hypothetical protein